MKVNEIDLGSNPRISELDIPLSNGVLYKSVPGMGATYSELNCKRNSIVVEPLKSIALLKTIGNEGRYHYYGSRKDFENRDLLLFNYLKDEKIEFKKIVCVADNLKSLQKALKHRFSKYFLLLDDIDAFQMDSTFRDSMEICLDIYKDHPKEKRALITATPLSFSDPIIKNEDRTNYFFGQVYKMAVYSWISDDPMLSAVRFILDNYEDDQIVVACNSIRGILKIAKTLRKYGIKKEYISVLSSQKNVEITKEYVTEMTENKYPCKINFITSAYFYGYDIDSTNWYRLLVICDCRFPYTVLSPNQIVQIAGRYRYDHNWESRGLDYPEYIKINMIFNVDKEKMRSIKKPNVEEMILKAEALCRFEKELFNFIKQFDLDINSELIDRYRLMFNFSNSTRDLLRRKGSSIEVSYLKIDSKVHDYERATWIYSNYKDGLFLDFNNLFGFMFNKIDYQSRNKALFNITSIKKGKIPRLESELFQVITDIEQNGFNRAGIVKLKELKGSVFYKIEKEIIELVIRHENTLGTDQLMQMVKKCCYEKGKLKHDARELNKLKFKLDFLAMKPRNTFKLKLNHMLPIGTILSMDEIVDAFKVCLSESKVPLENHSNKWIASLIKEIYLLKRKRSEEGDKFEILKLKL